MKRLIGLLVACLVLPASFAYADSAVDVILSTGTTQAFTDEAVPAEDLETILRAGVSAESAINQQPWFFVAVTDPAVLGEISGSGMGSFTPPAGMEGRPEGAPAGGSGAKASLGDSPAAIIIYKSTASKSPDASFDCGLATQNMVIAASSLGYGVKIISSPTMTLNGDSHDALCEKLGVDPSMQAVAVLLIGKADSSVDAASGATTREDFDAKTNIIAP